MKKILKPEYLLKSIFPGYKNYNINTMSPSLGKNGDKRIVSMLIIGDDTMIKDFKDDKSGQVDISTICYTKRNKNGIGQDLIIWLEFLYPTGHPSFKAVIYGDAIQEQKDFIEALESISELIIWVADKRYRVVKVMSTNWNYEAHKENLKSITTGGK